MRKHILITAASTVIASLTAMMAVSPTMAGIIPSYDYSRPSNSQLPPPPPPAPAPSSSGAWLRPYSSGNDAGVVGGYQTPAGTSFTGGVYVPPSGPPSGGVSITIPTRSARDSAGDQDRRLPPRLWKAPASTAFVRTGALQCLKPVSAFSP